MLAHTRSRKRRADMRWPNKRRANELLARRVSKHRLDVFEPLFGFCHEGVFGSFVRCFVGGAEAEEGAGIVPRDGADRLLGDEVLAGGFGVFEIDAGAQYGVGRPAHNPAVCEGFWRWGVEEVG